PAMVRPRPALDAGVAGAWPALDSLGCALCRYRSLATNLAGRTWSRLSDDARAVLLAHHHPRRRTLARWRPDPDADPVGRRETSGRCAGRRSHRPRHAGR